MRTCDGCTLCCTIERIPALRKPSNTCCIHAADRCLIYEGRPKGCRDFFCGWLKSPDMPDAMRPDKIGLYVVGGDPLEIKVDPDRPNAWKEGAGAVVIEHLIAGGNHLIVIIGRQLMFLPGRGREMPDKLLVDWLL